MGAHKVKHRSKSETDQEFIEARVEKTQRGCWLWLGSRFQNGYGVYCGITTHRRSYEAFKGPIPRGMHIDHLCLVKLCCNPDHLEAVSQAENNARAAGGTINRCKRGHSKEPGLNKGCTICSNAAGVARSHGVTLDEFFTSHPDYRPNTGRRGGSRRFFKD